MFDARLARARGAIEARLAREFATLNPLPVTEAMRYASHGGKALRGFLVLESAALHEIDAARAPSMLSARASVKRKKGAKLSQMGSS